MAETGRPGVGGLLAGRRVVVTGGANGLGAVAVRRFASAGARGVVLDLASALGHTAQRASEPSPDELPSGWAEVPVDVRDEDSVSSAMATATEALGGIDVVVAAAGIVPPWTDIAHTGTPGWDEVFAVNTRGVMTTIRQALPAIGPGGAIVVVASLNAWRGDPNLMSYTASKHAVLGIVRSAALQLGPAGIRVNAVAPGPVATEALLARMARRSGRDGPTEQAALEQAAAGTSLGRMATADEVADAMLFLAGDLSSGITGHLLPVDAGIH